MAAVGEQDRNIDHGQAAAQQQDRIGRPDARDARFVPGIADQPRAVAGLHAGRRRQPGRQVADAKHGDVGHARAVVVKLQPQHAVLVGKAHDAAANPAQGDVVGRRRFCVLQKLSQILPIDPACDEGMPGRRYRSGRMLRQIPRPQPAQEMGGIGRERAHVGDPRIEEQPVVPGCEGNARPEGRGLLDEQDLGGRRAASQQLDRQLGPAEAGADDRDAHDCLLRLIDCDYLYRLTRVYAQASNECGLGTNSNKTY